MQQRLDLLGTDQNQQYQAMLAAGLQLNFGGGGGDPLRQQFVHLQEPNHQYLQQQSAPIIHNSDLQQHHQQQQMPRHLLQSQTQILTENLPQQNMPQEVSNQAQQPDRVWQHSDLLSPSDFTNKFTSAASNPVQQQNLTLQGSGDSSSHLLNFSITGQSEQLPTQDWSLKHSHHPETNYFSEPLSLGQAYGRASPSSLEPPPSTQNLSLFGVDSDSGLFLPTTVPRFGGDTSSMPLADSGFQNNLQETTELAAHGVVEHTNNFVKVLCFLSDFFPSIGLFLCNINCMVKVYKSGSVGRSLDISRFSSYNELREELGKMFDIRGLLEDAFRSGWQLVFVDKEDDILLLGDDPWELVLFLFLPFLPFICSQV